jgi:hypothetical protein
MRAVVAYAAKDIRIEEVATPEVGPNEVRVRVGFGSICGSDLHYFNHGGFGAVRLREPMILGHEVAATVEEVGAAVTRVKPGDRAAVNPSLPCNACKYCLMGRQNECLDMRFYGSAMRMPHVHDAFRESLVCAEEQIYPVSDGTSLEMAALAEPPAVCVHAVRQAGDLVGRRDAGISSMGGTRNRFDGAPVGIGSAKVDAAPRAASRASAVLIKLAATLLHLPPFATAARHALRPRPSNPHRSPPINQVLPPRGFLLGRLSNVGPASRTTVPQGSASKTLHLLRRSLFAGCVHPRLPVGRL